MKTPDNSDSISLLVCGSRTVTDLKWVRCLADTFKYLKVSKVIHGGAKGADTLAGLAAQLLKLDEHVFMADWDRHGKAAGPIRNQEMLDEGRPDLVLALYPDTGITKGTKDMVDRARKAGVKCIEVQLPPEVAVLPKPMVGVLPKRMRETAQQASKTFVPAPPETEIDDPDYGF
jgi:hypothetical protein